MGNSLHNKIYLGRRSDRMRRLLAGMVAGLGVFLLAFKAFK
ncbi:hypothetical protein [Pseudoduganella lutea]|nr:hypothetical protein [Pseudoduganella lutea]